MDKQETEKNKALFQGLCHEFIKREGLDSLLAWLDGTDFYQAPSSANYHYNEPGGLCRHSVNVFRTACAIHDGVFVPAVAGGYANFAKEVPMESIAISTLFHDLCKVNLYHPKEKFRKNEANLWVRYLGYELNDDFPLGHGEKSCLLVRCHMKLTREEMLAIRWHMGMFDMGEQGSSQRYSFYNALSATPLVCLVHAADFLSSNLIEPTRDWKDLIIAD